MIGIICDTKESAQVEEFFELFKVPWEPYRSGNRYEAVISTVEMNRTPNAKLVILFGADKKEIDEQYHLDVIEVKEKKLPAMDGKEIPIYGRLAVLEGYGKPILRLLGGQENIGIVIDTGKHRLFRIGYNPFEELKIMFIHGQPREFSLTSTLEFHISIIRRILVSYGAQLLEVPPVPNGYPFICCLTHDVDFLGVKYHKFDHTFLGFLFRGVVVSGIRAVQQRKWSEFGMNLRSVFSIPFIFIGLKKDFWNQLDAYLTLEKDLVSTFFFIPFSNKPGRPHYKMSHAKRACKYKIENHVNDIRNLCSKGREIAVHGIDSWLDTAEGINERRAISRICGQTAVGIRMHWLYYDSESPKRIEEAGYLYDSTLGYNDAVGYWAGTGQAFKPLNTDSLLELPLNIQDTALFYPGRMGLSEGEAFELVKQVIDTAKEFGGVVVINWHQRSLAPERQWHTFYIRMIGLLKNLNPWFATAEHAAGWFRMRRSVVFERCDQLGRKIRVRLQGDKVRTEPRMPSLRLRVYKPDQNHNVEDSFLNGKLSFFDLDLKEDRTISLS